MAAEAQQWVLLAKGARGRGVVDLICRATSDPAVFAFGELLDVPSVSEVREGSPLPIREA